MIHLSESIPIPLLIAALCVLMLYPYIGAGILLAILCIGAGYYWLAALSFAVCIALHFAMRKRIKPVRGAVPPARPFRRRRKKKLHKHADSDGENAAEAEETETEATEVKETKAEETEAEETEVKETKAKETEVEETEAEETEVKETEAK